MKGYYELALYVLLEDATPEMIDVMMTASKEECLNLAHQIACKLNEKQYFEKLIGLILVIRILVFGACW